MVYSNSMTEEQALFIKSLRCTHNCTYRKIYELYWDEYKESIVKGSQAQGEYLVGLAEQVLGERFDDEILED